MNFDNLVIDRVLQGVAENSTGDILYILDQLANVQIDVTSESKDSKDSKGNTIKRFFTAKNVEVTAENALFDLNLAGEQAGIPKKVASAQSTIDFPRVYNFVAPGDVTDAIEGTAGGAVILPEAPKADITKIYKINNNGTLGQSYTVDTEESTTAFAYDSATHKITMPIGATGNFVVKYEYAGDSGVRVENTADKFPRNIKLTLSVLVADPCSVDTVRHAYIVFPSFQLSPDFSLTFDTETTHSFSGTAQVDYCGAKSLLYYITLSEDDTEDFDE